MTTPLHGAELLRVLDDHGVEHVIIGGFAVIAHGVIRTTQDLDICPDPAAANLRRLAGALTALDAVTEGDGEFDAHELPMNPCDPRHLAEGGNFRLRTRCGPLDLMQWIAGAPGDLAYPWLAEDAETAEALGLTLRVASLPKLLAMKRAAGRPQDLEDVARLELGHGDG